MPRTAHGFSLAAAIRTRAKSLAQAQNTYKQNLIAVNSYITGVLSSSLPQLKVNPPDWDDFVSAYEVAIGDALNWVNNVMTYLLNIPGEVQNYDSLVTMLLQDALAQSARLQTNPDDQMALEALNNDLAGLQDELGMVITYVSAAISRLQNFQDVLPDMATHLQAIAAASISDANADQQQIANLNAQVQQLQSDLQSHAASLIAIGLADQVALTLGTVASLAPAPIEFIAWLVYGPTVAVATSFIALDTAQINHDNQAIAQLESEITGMTADVATLTLLSNAYAAMASQTGQIQTDLQAILQQWQTLDSDVSNAVSDIQTAVSEIGTAVFEAVADDLDGAIFEWNAACAQAGALTVQINVNNAPLQVGMSLTQVQQALGQGRAVDIITYCNQVSAMAKARRRAA
jgi:hypothetical protein